MRKPKIPKLKWKLVVQTNVRPAPYTLVYDDKQIALDAYQATLLDIDHLDHVVLYNHVGDAIQSYGV